MKIYVDLHLKRNYTGWLNALDDIIFIITMVKIRMCKLKTSNATLPAGIIYPCTACLKVRSDWYSVMSFITLSIDFIYQVFTSLLEYMFRGGAWNIGYVPPTGYNSILKIK